MFGSVFASWKESLGLFKVGNFRLYCLATLNNFITSMPIVSIIFFASFIAWSIIFAVMNFFFSASLGSFLHSYHLFIALNLYQYLLISRPSIERKDHRYFNSYGWFNIFFMVPYLLLPSAFFPPIVFFTLFFIDLSLSFNSCILAFRNTLLLHAYSIPFICVLSLLSGSIGLISKILSIYALNSRFNPLAILAVITMSASLYALMVSACVIFYIKIKHAHHKLFFSK